ncbi:MAG: glycoside hydrolase family 75 protein [Dolichospermum sp.]|jgi:hypothetical protein|uniref:Fungal chitosanase n=2 Tax=Microcystis aeruginosa TaxID=1126 RepID=S3JQG0_MICAE|nr:glycoside hydrolase family 75 protein [Microcystis aeruginosa]NCR96868.1 hypothetical protein [Microcystis aeruginosa L311-01]OCY12294.1 MAG: hypothetical protein BEV12_10350 [Microcystis aeruginosa CACIAM 03]TRU14373.1 MAG: hypothetical protein EWV59_05295 [Microcystis aeruginosa Ma_MB_F_20061100_S19D]TRU18143.1 MAG: hypothetical protein EWV58_02800 [Microcystis aeruginosa Ma_MB_F_20061100_S19]EPF22222.1 Fungal chitosanase [Microcystis aeruginosa SPC777]
MVIKIDQPSNNATLAITDNVNFKGTASHEIVRIELWAENKWHFGNSSVSNGNWSVSYRFTDNGKRQIEARGFDQDNHSVASEKITLEIEASSISCEPRTKLFEIGGHSVWQIAGQTAFFYQSKMSIDADGAPNAYHPDNIGLDDLKNAGYPNTSWWKNILVPDPQNPNRAYEQPSGPYQGYFVSMTALQDGTKAKTDPSRYVDSTRIPYIVLPGGGSAGAKLGDFAVVFNGKNGKIVNGIYADVGPSNKIGEGSIALAEALGIPSSPRTGGVSSGIMYVVFPGSGNGKPRSLSEINTEAEKHFNNWGGMARLNACFSPS